MWIYSTYITKNGERIYAKTYGKKLSVFGWMMIRMNVHLQKILTSPTNSKI